MGAPVCNINPKNPPPQSLAPTLPSIPIATDVPSLIAAVNALRQWIIQYTNQGQGGSGGPNNQNQGGGTNPGGGPKNQNQGGGGGGTTGNLSNFAEKPNTRQTTTNRIYDPNDPTNQTYVDVKQITGLSFSNKAGQTISWKQ